ncbi:hypothetical protein [Ruminococcus intestinalis]
MKKLNPKKVFIIADGSYREITPQSMNFGKKPMQATEKRNSSACTA